MELYNKNRILLNKWPISDYKVKYMPLETILCIFAIKLLSKRKKNVMGKSC